MFMQRLLLVPLVAVAGCLPVPVQAGLISMPLHPLGMFVKASAMECWIDVERQGSQAQLRGMVRGGEATVARASMMVRRTSRAGVSNNTQGGVFRVPPGGEVVVGHVFINAAPGDDLSADLTVEWDGGRTSCAYP